MQESPCIVQLVLKKRSMETLSSKWFARHFILCYVNTAYLGFDQKSKNMHIISSLISKLFKNDTITYNHKVRQA